MAHARVGLFARTVVRRMKLGSYLSSWSLTRKSACPGVTLLGAIAIKWRVTSVELVNTFPLSVRVGRVPWGFCGGVRTSNAQQGRGTYELEQLWREVLYLNHIYDLGIDVQAKLGAAHRYEYRRR